MNYINVVGFWSTPKRGRAGLYPKDFSNSQPTHTHTVPLLLLPRYAPWTRVWTKQTALARNKKERRAVSKHNTQKRRRRLFLGNVTSFCLLHPICWPPMPHFLPAAGCLWRGRLADPSIVGLSLLRLLPSVRTGNRPPVTSTECTASGASYSREERTNKFWGRLKLLSYLSAKGGAGNS